MDSINTDITKEDNLNTGGQTRAIKIGFDKCLMFIRNCHFLFNISEIGEIGDQLKSWIGWSKLWIQLCLQWKPSLRIIIKKRNQEIYSGDWILRRVTSAQNNTFILVLLLCYTLWGSTGVQLNNRSPHKTINTSAGHQLFSLLYNNNSGLSWMCH